MIPAARADHPDLSVRRLAALYGGGRTWYYTPPTPEEVAARDTALRAVIERVVLEFPGAGYRRVTRALVRDGWEVNHKRVLRVMRRASLLCQLKRHFVVTTDAQHPYRTDPNLLRDLPLTRLDQAWVTDITDIRLPRTFVYLAASLDAFCRRCVGWHLSRTIDTALPLAALEHALTARRPAPGLIHHSDRGVQYASGPYVARLEEVGARISMSAVGTLRQRQGGAFLQDAQARGGVPERLPHVRRGAGRPRPLHR